MSSKRDHVTWGPGFAHIVHVGILGFQFRVTERRIKDRLLSILREPRIDKQSLGRHPGGGEELRE
jgi:hypothetical protein